MSTEKLERGFTLLEILIVIVIASILLAVALPQYRQARETSRVAACSANLRTLAQTTRAIRTLDVPLPLAHEQITPNEMDLWDLPAETWLCPADLIQRPISYSYVPGAFMQESGWLADPSARWQRWTEELFETHPGLPLFEDWLPVHPWAGSGARLRVGIEGDVRLAKP